MLGIKVAPSTVWEILNDVGVDPAPERSATTWIGFLSSQAETLLTCDFLETVPHRGAADRADKRIDAISLVTPRGRADEWFYSLVVESE